MEAPILLLIVRYGVISYMMSYTMTGSLLIWDITEGIDEPFDNEAEKGEMK